MDKLITLAGAIAIFAAFKLIGSLGVLLLIAIILTVIYFIGEKEQ